MRLRCGKSVDSESETEHVQIEDQVGSNQNGPNEIKPLHLHQGKTSKNKPRRTKRFSPYKYPKKGANSNTRIRKTRNKNKFEVSVINDDESNYESNETSSKKSNKFEVSVINDDESNYESNETSSKKSNETSSKKSNETSSKKSNETSSKKSNETSSKKSNETSSKKSNKTSSKKSNDESDDESDEKSNDDSDEKSNDESDEKSNDESDEKSNDESDEKSDEKSNDESNDETMDEFIVQDEEIDIRSLMENSSILPLTNLIKSFTSSYDASRKVTKASDIVQDDDPHELFFSKSWFKNLSSKKKLEFFEAYRSFMREITQAPNIKDVLNLDITNNKIKTELADYIVQMNCTRDETFTPFSTHYQKLKEELIKKFSVVEQEQKKILEVYSREEEIKSVEEGKLFSDDELKEKILYSNFSDDIKKIIFKKYQRMKLLSYHDSDRDKIHNWLENVLSLPQRSSHSVLDGFLTCTPDEISKKFLNLRATLDKNIYGMSDAKDLIISIIANWYTNPNATSCSIGLVGPPGVGKTDLIRSTAMSFGMAFEQISLGGVRDSAFIEGHSSTYVGAQPGIIVKSLQKMKCNNGIIFLDEIDKLAETEHGMEVQYSLLRVVDFTQNKEFIDHFMPEIPVDLSKIFFIYSLNDKNSINKILLDRLHLIEIDGYTKDEKVKIVRNHSLPKICKNIGLVYENSSMNESMNSAENENMSNGGSLNQFENSPPINTLSPYKIIISDDLINYIINCVDCDKLNENTGMREINNSFEYILRKLNYYELTQQQININTNINVRVKYPFILTNEMVDFLFMHKKMNSKDKYNMYS
jgi:hypothetical protein